MLDIVFLHQNFPGQFRHLAPALAAAGHRVRALALNERPVGPGVARSRYAVQRRPGADTHPLLREAETKVLRGEACVQALGRLAADGVPDLVIANPGWGEALFVKDLLPQAPLVCLLEFYYGTAGGDVGFDPEFAQPGLAERMRQRLKNLALTEALLAMDQGVAPTAWQASRLPQAWASRVEVVFDGIDTDRLQPDPAARFTWPAAGLDLKAGQQVVTFVNRQLEPYRGYHSFMRSLPALQRRCPQAEVVLVGGDGVSYGAAAPAGRTWKQHFLDEVAGQLDLSRVHFVGPLPYDDLVRLLQVSAAHVYLTYPFVLSWSCLEAMSLGCHVVASRTAPVLDFIEDGVNGSLVDFFDADALAERVAQVLHDQGSATDRAIRRAARDTAVQRCDLQRVCLPRWRALLSRTMGQPV